MLVTDLERKLMCERHPDANCVSITRCTQQEQEFGIQLGAEIEGVGERRMKFGIDDVIPLDRGLGQNKNSVIFALELLYGCEKYEHKGGGNTPKQRQLEHYRHCPG